VTQIFIIPDFWATEPFRNHHGAVIGTDVVAFCFVPGAGHHYKVMVALAPHFHQRIISQAAVKDKSLHLSTINKTYQCF
jgi:hypothetical protein